MCAALQYYNPYVMKVCVANNIWKLTTAPGSTPSCIDLMSAAGSGPPLIPSYGKVQIVMSDPQFKLPI